MNKTTKGSLAAGAAAVLLLGGAGSLAFWTDSAIVNGGAVNSGFLTLDSVPTPEGDDCTTPVYADGFAGNGAPVVNFVPGDVISTTCEFVIAAEGDNLAATPTIPAEIDINGPAGTSFVGSVAATYTLAGADYTGATKITEGNDEDALVATLTVTVDYGTDETGTPIVNGNNTQNIDAVLDELTVSLVQDDPNP